MITHLLYRILHVLIYFVAMIGFDFYSASLQAGLVSAALPLKADAQHAFLGALLVAGLGAVAKVDFPAIAGEHHPTYWVRWVDNVKRQGCGAWQLPSCS